MALKLPVKIEDLMNEWSSDAIYDETEPHIATANIPKLHAKYANVLSYHSLIVKKLQSDYNKLKSVKTDWYAGLLNNPEDLARYNLEPMMERIDRARVPAKIDQDEELIELLLKKSLHQEIVDYATSVVKELNSRTYQLGNIIKYTIYLQGHQQ